MNNIILITQRESVKLQELGYNFASRFEDGLLHKSKSSHPKYYLIVDGVIKSITDELIAGGKVQLVGFGTFEVVERAAREGRNPLTGESLHIEASKAPKFKPGKALKDAVKNA